MSTHLAALLAACAGCWPALPAADAAPGALPAANLLADAPSPYLRSHAENPVHWRPWGDAAFAEAAAAGKPVLLSIGYATCHWCHVMARESFSDPAIAALLNERYVCIKVDREERPDVDQLYQTFVQAATGSGGWPLTVWLTPERRPLVGGTYFPPALLKDNLTRFAAAWKERRGELTAQAEDVVKTLVDYGARGGQTQDPSADGDGALFSAAAAAFTARFDTVHGGFGGAPKFPRPASLDLLVRLAARLPAERERLLGMCRTTWAALAAGGIHDQLGGGFHRYAVDAAWRVPHFEKMLYDQAQLLDSYLDAWALSGDPAWRAVALDIVDYVLGNLRRADGSFAAAEDADSERPDRPGEHGEGAFYTWSAAAVAKVLGAGGDGERLTPLIFAAYGIAPAGNVSPALDRQHELAGLNVLALTAPVPEADAAAFATARARLLAARQSRPRPARDDQAVAAWNGLMIAALARAGMMLGEPRALAAAVAAAEALRASHWQSGVFLARTGFNRQTAAGTASDYACLIRGLLALHQAGAGLRWLAWAVELQDVLDRQFWDEAAGGYASADARVTGLVARLHDDGDGAEPSADAVATRNLLVLTALTEDDIWQARVTRLLAGARRRGAADPEGHPALLGALDEALGDAAHLTIMGDPAQPATRALLAAAAAGLRPRLRILILDDGPELAALRQRFPAIVPMPRSGGQATAYLCIGRRCLTAVTTPAELTRQLEQNVDGR